MPRGFFCASKNCGLKLEGNDLSVFYSKAPASAAAVFTRNQFPGAPVILGRETIRSGRLRAVVVNSKISNVGTGEQGMENARRMARAAAIELDVPPDEVLVSSTGVIAKQLAIEKIETGISGIKSLLTDDPLVGASGIMTTDTFPKALSVSVANATVTVVAKGSGMIEPNMATMLAYIFTDAALSAGELDGMLRRAVDVSFNMLSVDTDTSTSDTCAIMANGLAGPVPVPFFEKALTRACIEMAKKMARDGEGATKLIEVQVSGAATTGEARVVAKSIVNSPLIKTMAYGADPNIGRVLMAVGKCHDCRVDPGALAVRINETVVFEALQRPDFNENLLRGELGGEHVVIAVDMGIGEGAAVAFGCDLTEGYIRENAAYYSS
jgi:glutamate N-acetyltransferase/amino-acid N-acetyltransferase